MLYHRAAGLVDGHLPRCRMTVWQTSAAGGFQPEAERSAVGRSPPVELRDLHFLAASLGSVRFGQHHLDTPLIYSNLLASKGLWWPPSGPEPGARTASGSTAAPHSGRATALGGPVDDHVLARCGL